MRPNAPQSHKRRLSAAPEPARFPHIICGFLLRRVANATAHTVTFLWNHMAAWRDKQLRRSSAAPAMGLGFFNLAAICCCGVYGQAPPASRR